MQLPCCAYCLNGRLHTQLTSTAEIESQSAKEAELRSGVEAYGSTQVCKQKRLKACGFALLPKGAIELLSNLCAINPYLTIQVASVNMSMVCANAHYSASCRNRERNAHLHVSDVQNLCTSGSIEPKSVGFFNGFLVTSLKKGLC